MTALLQELWQGLLDPVSEREGHHPAAHAHTATVQLRQECLKTALRKEQQACSIQEAGDLAQLRDLGIHASLRLGITPAQLEAHHHTPLQTFREGTKPHAATDSTCSGNSASKTLRSTPTCSSRSESLRGSRQESTVADLRRTRNDRRSLGLSQRRAGKALKGGR